MNKIYFDLDGVMANLDTAIAKHTNLHHWPDGRLTKEHWATLEKVPNLFYTLPVCLGALKMFDMVYARHNARVEILTATPDPTGLLDTAADDKSRWVRDHISKRVVVNTVHGGKNKYKWLEQNPDSILIDDYARNINQWVDAGGTGILHTDADSTIMKLRVLGVL